MELGGKNTLPGGRRVYGAGGVGSRRDTAASGFAVLLCDASALSVVAALANLWVVPAFFVDAWGYDTVLWWSYAALYLLVSAGQGLYGVVLLRWPSQPLFLAGIGANLLVVVLYVATRAREVSLLGPGTGYAGAGAWAELLAMAAEVGVIFFLVLLLRGRMRERVMTGLLVVGFGIWALWLLELLS